MVFDTKVLLCADEELILHVNGCPWSSVSGRVANLAHTISWRLEEKLNSQHKPENGLAEGILKVLLAKSLQWHLFLRVCFAQFLQWLSKLASLHSYIMFRFFSDITTLGTVILPN